MSTKPTKKQKILYCYGYMNYKSIAKVVGCSIAYVYNTMNEAGLKAIYTGHHAAENW